MEPIKIIILPTEGNQIELISDLFYAYGCKVEKSDVNEKEVLTIINESSPTLAVFEIQVRSIDTDREIFKPLLKNNPPQRGTIEINPKQASSYITTNPSNQNKSKLTQDNLVISPSNQTLVPSKASNSSHGYVFKDCLFIRSNSLLVKLKFEDIIYLEADANYTQVFTTEKKHIIRASMKDLQKKMDGKRFARVHKSFLINLEKIECIHSESIQIAGKEIPIGRTQYSWLLRQIKIL
ncbi:MAG: LytR/AlgR family response regulator transcription factor [Algoriphagus aquaeductus]|jgi:hypothetical protein|uniref:LytR/AlgR family response regulator transcription factor n=1 Tax=Algoriphagus aquaeductus TaxID=475299 RepID=UPI0038795EF7